MIKHRMGEGKAFWNVPGGGMQFGQNAKENLKREFYEETGLTIDVGNYLFVHEFLSPPLHALELFFEVHQKGGALVLGTDPELGDEQQLIEDIRFLSLDEIKLLPLKEKHEVFSRINSFNDVRIWKGYFNFENNCIK